MNKLLNFINEFKYLYLLFGFVMMARPAYSIPTTIDEIKQSVGSLCADYGLEFCALEPEAEKKAKKAHKFTESEKKILTRLAEQQERLRLRAMELDRREGQLKTLQEDIQRQITRLEKLQREIERNIEKKKTQDNKQLEKAVALYSKMDAVTAAQSISKLDRTIAVNILKQMKEKQASLVLSSMRAEESASLIKDITRKN
jgi:flagellar motility protein MotE (MotC chaperone)